MNAKIITRGVHESFDLERRNVASPTELGDPPGERTHGLPD